jgi:hypothetical protein
VISCWIIVVISWSIFTPSNGGIQLRADEVAEGFAEKSLAMIVRNNEVYLEYQVGLNPLDLKREGEQWGVLSPETDATAIHAQFAAGLGEYLLEHLQLTIDGQDVVPEIVEVRGGGPHHVSASVQLKFNLPELTAGEAKIFDVLIVENTFEHLDGAIRLACKAQRGAMLRESNSAMLIVRADRQVFTEMDADQRQEASSIKSKILLTPPKEQRAVKKSGVNN